MASGSNRNDAFFGSAMQFMQAGQQVAQQIFESFSQSVPGTPAELTLDPQALTALQKKYSEQQLALWHSVLGKHQGAPEVDFSVSPEPGDRRFSAPEWRENPLYDYLHQVYLLNSRYLRELAESLPSADEKSKNRMRFLVRQLSDALAPSNFAATNPEFIQRALATQGQSITDGINNLIGDFEKGRISMTDESVFEVGKNIATTEGAVVFENEVMQLLQYAPLTPKVGSRPLLVVPPCINKFYIMDLQPDNSLIRFMVEQGNTVFLVSWRNPQEAQGHLGWDDYLEQGPIAALWVVRELCKVKQVNVLGFCVGGTIVTSALAVLKARGDDAAASLTLLTTLLDFSDTGEIGLFIDENALAAREQAIGQGGILPARDLQNTFSFLRANDLVWNYVTGNYLKGEKPKAFDLLYWNSDSTRMPAAMHSFYLRNMYLDNLLKEPGGITLGGVKIDISKVKTPCYFISTIEDHIAPWKSTYMGARLPSGNTKFVLGGSGHIAGIVNPPVANKYGFWTNDATDGNLPESPDDFLAGATQNAGSWWTHWNEWVTSLPGGSAKVKARQPADGSLKVIEDAPGAYVKFRLDAQK